MAPVASWHDDEAPPFRFTAGEVAAVIVYACFVVGILYVLATG